jgi:hypothetical protein
MKRWIAIFVFLALLGGQTAHALHDHPMLQEPASCIVCSHLHCFTLPATALAPAPPTPQIIGKTVPETIACHQVESPRVVSYAPKTSPPF